jgi:hypothetical protein
MRILMRSGPTGSWRAVESLRYDGEAELQKLLADDPTLIPVADIRSAVSPLSVGIREVSVPGSGSIDILAFSNDGDIAIIECKLAANAEIKRKVVGQLFEYAAFVWQMSYAELDAIISQKTGIPLADLVASKVTEGNFDRETFRNEITARLRDGDFILVIVVDEITDELERTIQFLNEAGGGRFSFHALEMERFGTDGTEILVPHLHGSAAASAPANAPGRQPWTDERFFEVIRAKTPDLEAIYQDLMGWMQRDADQTRFGKGKVNGSFAFWISNGARFVSLFFVETSGYLYFPTSGWRAFPEDLILEFHRRLTQIEGFQGIPLDFVSWPTKPMAIFRESAVALPAFKQAVEEFHGKVRLAATRTMRAENGA